MISRAPVIGHTLTTSHGSWHGGPSSYSYQWLDCAIKTHCKPISGATAKSYRVQANDFDYNIRARVRACNSRGCTSVVSTPTDKVTGAQPSGEGLPPRTVTDSFGTTWKEIGEDNFTVNAPLGSWATSNPNAIVYTGDHGLKWHENPDGWSCEAIRNCYRPADVLSVHKGVLDFWLHNCRYPDRVVAACGASPGPMIPTTHTPYQTYGRYEVRLKVIFNDRRHLGQYHFAWMLWPEQDRYQPCAESDFPETTLNQRSVGAYAHWGCRGRFNWFLARRTNLTKWHTFTQEWGPGFRRYYLDGRLLGQSTHQVWSRPERWELQTPPLEKARGSSSGHMLVDWVWIGVRRRK